MKNTMLYVLMFTVFICTYSGGTVVHVPDEYPNIQDAIEAVRDGDTVLVADGTYAGPGNRDIEFYGKGCLVKSENGPESTIINCQGSVPDARRGFYFHGGEDSSSVLNGFTIMYGYAHSSGGGIYCASSPLIINCKITLCEAGFGGGGLAIVGNSFPEIRSCEFTANYSTDFGGALYCASSVLMVDCVFENNSSFNRGAGAGFQYAEGIISGCIFRDNFCVQGAGVACMSTDSLIFENCEFINNETDASAGAMYCQISSPILRDCRFDGNSTDGLGALLCEYESSPTLIGCIFDGNESLGGAGVTFGLDCYPTIIGCVFDGNECSVGPGGGLQLSESGGIIANNLFIGNTANNGGAIALYDSSPIIRGNTFSENMSRGHDGYGGSVYCEGQSFPILTNNILWGDSATDGGNEIYVEDTSEPIISYCDIEGGWEGEENIDCDPIFCDPGEGNYFLDAGSCCVGAGEGGADIGAFGVGCGNIVLAYLAGDANMYNETVDLGDPLTGPWRVGVDVTFLVSYFDVTSGNQPCLMYNPNNTDDYPGGPVNGYYFASADATGEGLLTGGDVSRLVSYFGGTAEIKWYGWDKPDPENYYRPLWLNNRGSGLEQPAPPLEDLPAGWPNCQTPPGAARVLPSNSVNK